MLKLNQPRVTPSKGHLEWCLESKFRLTSCPFVEIAFGYKMKGNKWGRQFFEDRE
jgi:hypothetical protein